MKRSALLLIALAAAGAPLRGQDTVRVGITYQPGVRPGLVVLPAPGLDSVRAIVDRDLTFSDRFEVISLTQTPGGSPLGPVAINYPFYRNLGAALAVEQRDRAAGASRDALVAEDDNAGTAVVLTRGVRSKAASPAAATAGCAGPGCAATRRGRVAGAAARAGAAPAAARPRTRR